MQETSIENKVAMGAGPAFGLYEKWFTIVRIVGVVLVCSLIYVLSKFGMLGFDPAPIIYIIGPAFLVLSLTWLILRQQNMASQSQIYLELFGDLAAITAGIHFAGGTRSPFVFIYLAVCVTASTVSIPVTILISLMTSSSYLLMFYLEHTGTIPALTLYTGAIQSGEIIDGSVLILTIIIIAFQSSFYISRIKEEDKKMLEREEEIRKFKEDFLFKTVHDLRAPGTSIRLAIEELTSGNKWACNTDAMHAEDTISIIQELDQRMLNLVNDILKIGKSENAEMEYKKERVNVHEIVEGIMKTYGPIAVSRKIVLEHAPGDDLLPVLADKDKVTEVFANLIDNAIKYSRDDGKVMISHAANNGFAMISIMDNGVGIPEMDIAKLFAPYFRSETGKAVQGTGLGLYIVKNLVEKMGGKISATSKVGEGTTFTVSLPLA